MKYAVGYIRVSSERQVKEGQGLEIQEKSIRKYCKENNIELINIFSDEGISGAESLDKREGLAQAIEQIKSLSKTNKPVDYLIAQKLDRVARNTMLLGYLEFELTRVKCSIISSEQKFEDTPNGGLMKDIIVAFASFEKKMINMRTNSGKKNKLSKKLHTSGNIPIGYKSDGENIVINEDERPIIQFIFHERITGQSYRSISNDLKKIFNIALSYSSIKYILENTIYMGKFRQENTYIDVPNIISTSSFYRARKIGKK
ncbi:recombinase family protein [Fusobacterium perfoetens]|uniref:recombinase family protein n=1 Tax=Fusobacterium perfoetens TaxID=852 RepID=UPI001F2BEFA8|nr:recombinase family protein [Fusobacterium perfoetens]MCF2625935.1 recombinase family protein [Fusobacterium perfoetens]